MITKCPVHGDQIAPALSMEGPPPPGLFNPRTTPGDRMAVIGYLPEPVFEWSGKDSD